MSEKFKLLENLATTDIDKKKEFALRQFDFHEERIKPAYRVAKESEGWKVVKEYKDGRLVIQLPKSDDAALEDRVWRLLYQFGYSELNTGRQFRLPPLGALDDPRQIDVFAKDDETVVIVECKDQAKLGGKNLSSVINDLANRRQTMMNYVRNHYKRDDLKLITLLVTDGIRWGEHDLKLAKDNQVHNVTERELKYYAEIARNLGSAAKYQFHAEFLKGQRVKSLQLSFPAICQRIGGKRAYVFSAPASQLIKLTFVNHRDLKDPENAPAYQRMLKKNRLTQVSSFINKGGYFANSILLSLNEGSKDGARFEPKEKSDDNGISYGILKLPEFYKSLRVIDGQHRLYGAAESERKDAPVIVVALVNIKESEEAKLFKEINKEQKGVDASLLTSLEGALGQDSDEPAEQLRSVAARIIEFLIEDPKYAFNADTGELKSATATSTLVKSGLLGTVRSKDRIRINGILTGTSDGETLNNSLGFFGPYFNTIRNTNLALWNGDFGDRTFGAPRTNVFLSAHISFVASFAKRYCNANMTVKELTKLIEPFHQAYCRVISNMSVADYRDRFMSVNYGGAGQEEFKFKIAMAIFDEEPELHLDIDGLTEKRHATDRTRINNTVDRANFIADGYLRIARSKIAVSFPDNFWAAESGFLTQQYVAELMKRKSEQRGTAGTSFENYMLFGDISKFLVNKAPIWNVLKDSFHIKTGASEPGTKKHVAWMSIIERFAKSTVVGILSDDDEATVEVIYNRLLEDETFRNLPGTTTGIP